MGSTKALDCQSAVNEGCRKRDGAVQLHYLTTFSSALSCFFSFFPPPNLDLTQSRGMMPRFPCGSLLPSLEVISATGSQVVSSSSVHCVRFTRFPVLQGIHNFKCSFSSSLGLIGGHAVRIHDIAVWCCSEAAGVPRRIARHDVRLLV
jgi:hypothetical protein